MKSNITKAVIPAAGEGSRLQPLTNYISKPMLPLGKKPVLQHIIEEFKCIGIKEIAVIARSSDDKMISYFEEDHSVQFIFDDSLSGPGGAIRKAEYFIGEEHFMVAFSDAPLKGKEDKTYLEQLLSLKKDQNISAALAIYPIAKSEVSHRGVVKCEAVPQPGGAPLRISRIIEKPVVPIQNPWAVACRYVLDASIFEVLKNTSINEDNERQLTPALQELISQDKTVLGYPLPNKLKRYDTGNFKSYFEAQKAFINDS